MSKEKTSSKEELIKEIMEKQKQIKASLEKLRGVPELNSKSIIQIFGNVFEETYGKEHFTVGAEDLLTTMGAGIYVSVLQSDMARAQNLTGDQMLGATTYKFVEKSDQLWEQHYLDQMNDFTDPETGEVLYEIDERPFTNVELIEMSLLQGMCPPESRQVYKDWQTDRLKEAKEFYKALAKALEAESDKEVAEIEAKDQQKKGSKPPVQRIKPPEIP